MDTSARFRKESASYEDVKSQSIEEVLKKLNTSEKGLSSEEAQKRLDEYGPNAIPEHKRSPLKKFMGYFWGPIPGMIEIAAILSALIQRWEDFVIITLLLLLNAVVGFWQENKADNAIELLRKRMALKARVLRDGKWNEVPSSNIVPGDIVWVRLGEIIPADIKLLDKGYLLIDESALTGESLPVEKHQSDIAFSGSVVQQGEMNAVVLSTGVESYLGKTTQLVAGVITKSHFQKALLKIGDYLIVLAAILVTMIFIVSLFRHNSILETLQFSLVLTVAAIPAALPAVLSVSMAVGAVELAKKGAIVSKLVAIEEMAGMDILCSDKTGTITQNKLTLADIVTFTTEKDVLMSALMASREEDRDAIDNAILGKIKSMGEFEDTSSFKTVDFKPFDPVAKRTEATIKDSKGAIFKVTKGAPQVIVEMVGNNEISEKVDNAVNAFAEKGYRALAVAKSKTEDKWEMLGILALYDPPYEDSAETIKTALSMNVKIKMITGDHTAIAREIAGRVGLGTNIVPAASLLAEDNAADIVEKADGFSQVFPEHKYKIVELLQSKDHIVGMTGDGVNDAPALKKADIGIAVAGATDAAKSAADIVFTHPGLSVIIDAIKESRIIFQRMKSYAIYRIAETIRVLLFITLSILAFNFYPVTALMIVLLALFNDAPIMAIAYDNVRYRNQPERWEMREVLSMATFLGIIGVFSSFLIFYIGRDVIQLDPNTLQSFIFLKLAVAGHLTIFLARTRSNFWTIRPSGLLFWSAILTKILATLIVVYGIYLTPLGWKLSGLVWIYSIVAFVITDFIKVRLYILLDHRGLKFSR